MAESLVNHWFLLWRVSRSEKAYQDQFERWHDGMLVHEVARVVVVEERVVPGDLSGQLSPHNIGLRAIDVRGTEYTRCWRSYPEDYSAQPAFYWHSPEKIADRYHSYWVDAVEAFNRKLPPYIWAPTVYQQSSAVSWPPGIRAKLPSSMNVLPVILICTAHNLAYYANRASCPRDYRKMEDRHALVRRDRRRGVTGD